MTASAHRLNPDSTVARRSPAGTTVSHRSRPMALSDLRRILALDAATCIAMGALLLAASAPLSTWLGLPAALLTWAGIVLFPSAALMLAAAARRPPPASLTWLVIAGNAAWVVASIVVAFGPLHPTLIGQAFVVAQAAVVVVLLALEWRALREPG